MRVRGTRLQAISGGVGSSGSGSIDPLWRLAGVAPALDLLFAQNQSLVDVVSGQPLVTLSRASSGTFFDSAGVLQTASTNAPPFDHNPETGESLGLLVEEARTNHIRNNTMVGAVAGIPGTNPINWSISNTPSGLQKEIVGTGTTNGIIWSDIRWSGTTNATNSAVVQPEAATATIAADGQSWTAASWIAVVGGSTANIDKFTQRVTGRSAVGVLLQKTDTTFTPTNILTRYTASRTMADASIERVTSDILFSHGNGAAIDITLRIGMPQLEQGTSATSVIPTATATTTRSASFVDLINSAIANNIRSFYLEFRSPAVGVRGVVSFNDNTANERASVITSGTDPRLVVVDGGVEQANIDGGTMSAGVRIRVAVRLNENDFAISVNGGAVLTDASGTLPTVDRIMFGRTQAGEFLNGTIARFTGWNEPLSNATLQTLTAQ